MKRREFVQKSSLCGAALASYNLYDLALPDDTKALSSSGGIGIEEGPYILEKGKEQNIAPVVRPEIRNNPRAVFLIETHVDSRKDENGFFTGAIPQLQEAGRQVVSELFVKGFRKGGSTLLKPNFTYVAPEYYNRTCGVMTSPDFVAGFAERLRELGNTNVIAGERIGGGPGMHRKTGVYKALDSKDVNLIEASYAEFSHYRKDELNWSKTRGSIIWKNIPHWRPIGDSDNTLINIAKLKTHDIGLTTLAVKNLQGAVPRGHGHFCDPWAKMKLHSEQWDLNFKRDYYRDYQQRIEASFRTHLDAGYKNLDYFNIYPKYLEKGGWDAFRKIAQKRLEGASVAQQYEVRRIKKDETIIWCEMMATRIEYRGAPAIMGNIIAITKRKQAEQALRETEKRLYEEEKRMELLKFANDVALKLMHDLRNPMVTIGGFSKRLSGNKYPEDKVQQYTKIIFEESVKLDNVLKKVLAHLKSAAEQV